MKRSEESSSLNILFFRRKLAHVVSSRDTAYLWDKESSSNPKTRGVRDTHKCEPGKKKYKLRMLFGSVSFGVRTN